MTVSNPGANTIGGGVRNPHGGITQVNTGITQTGNNSTTQQPRFTIPATAQVGDTLLAVAQTYDAASNNPFTTPGGWTLLDAQRQAAYNNSTAALYSKTCQPGDPGATVTLGSIGAGLLWVTSCRSYTTPNGVDAHSYAGGSASGGAGNTYGQPPAVTNGPVELVAAFVVLECGSAAVASGIFAGNWINGSTPYVQGGQNVVASEDFPAVAAPSGGGITLSAVQAALVAFQAWSISLK